MSPRGIDAPRIYDPFLSLWQRVIFCLSGKIRNNETFSDADCLLRNTKYLSMIFVTDTEIDYQKSETIWRPR